MEAKTKKTVIIGVILIILMGILINCTAQIAPDSVSSPVEEKTKWEVVSISIMTGETPLTKGLTFTPAISKGKWTIVADFNAELGEIMFFFSPTKKNWISFGPSAGFFKNSPWIGPILSFSLFKGHFKTLNWVGWGFGDPEKATTEIEPTFLFSYHQFSLVSSWERFGAEAYYVLQHYQKNIPEHIVGAKIEVNCFPNLYVSPGLGYMIHAKKYLWSIALTYRFNHN